MDFEEREYQGLALDSIRELWKQGKRKILLWLATGGGKTHIFCTILIRTKLNCLMVVRGRDLVQNAHLRLWNEKVPHGVKMAGHWNVRPSERIQIGSIDTLMCKDKHTGKLKNDLPKIGILIIDEVHFATSKTFRELIAYYDEQEVLILGVTATPYTTYGLGHVCEEIVHPITMDELMDEAFLVTPIYYGTLDPDLKGVKSGEDGDYNQKQLESVVNTNEIVGDLVQHWLQLGQARPTLGFAVTVKHSKDFVAAFENAGIKARHLDANATDHERDEALKDLHEGRLKIIFNVGIFTTGKDIPFLGCIIDAAPTKSLIKHQQKLGRGTRAWHGDKWVEPKNDFIVIDHAGNVPKHGSITTEYEPNLEKDKEKKKKYENSKPNKTCKKCFFIWDSGEMICPSCGFVEPPKPLEIVDGLLQEINPVDVHKKALRDLRLQSKREKRAKGWVYHRLVEKFGAKIASELIPPMSERQKNFLRNKTLMGAANELLRLKK